MVENAGSRERPIHEGLGEGVSSNERQAAAVGAGETRSCQDTDGVLQLLVLCLVGRVDTGFKIRGLCIEGAFACCT